MAANKPTTKTKNAYFYRAFIIVDGVRKYPGSQDWTGILDAVGGMSLEDRTLDGDIFEPARLPSGLLLGIHRPINTDFMSQIKDGTVADLMQGASGNADGFAYSTAVAFLNEANVFAISLGTNTSPRANTLAKFLDAFVPPEDQGAFWKVEPLVDDDEIRKLNKSVGLVEFSSKFTTARNLFDQGDGSIGLVSIGDKIADAIGGDVEITVEVKLSPAARTRRSAKEKLLNLFKGDIQRLAAKGSGAKAMAMVSEGVMENLSLVEHNLAAEFEMKLVGTESRQFTELLAALGNVSAEMEDKVNTILEG